VNKFLENTYYKDKVVVVQQSAQGENSWVRAVLDQGETFTQSNWAGSGSPLIIEACFMTDGTPDIAQVTIWLDGVNSVENCEVPPTISPAPTPSYKEIEYVGNPCGDAFPLTGLCEECTGDCDDDSDCEGDMICFQRSSGDLDVPGCVWGENSDDIKNDSTDICIKPNTEPGVISYVGKCDSSSPCGLCKGDCDSDSGCESGLKCFQRDGNEAVPNCVGEGGAYDSAGADICYSTSPTPTAPTPTAPTPTAPTPTVTTPTSSTCEDSTLRFQIVNNGKKITRDCTWVSNKPYRCNVIAGANTHCPNTCGRCSICEDATNRFKVFLKGKKRARDCIWVANRSTNIRCKLDGISDTCRDTCGTC
jgi:hypothetical protein